MQSHINPDVHLDRQHARAVCQGIGELMRDTIKRSWVESSPHLKDLYRRLPELDRELSPSIVPAMDAH